MSQYWSFRSYKAQLLPSLNLSGNLGNYNRSLVDVRDPETGRISYVANNTLSNDLSVYINQKIALTGGTCLLTPRLPAWTSSLTTRKLITRTGHDQLHATATFFQHAEMAEENGALAVREGQETVPGIAGGYNASNDLLFLLGFVGPDKLQEKRGELERYPRHVQDRSTTA